MAKLDNRVDQYVQQSEPKVKEEPEKKFTDFTPKSPEHYTDFKPVKQPPVLPKTLQMPPMPPQNYHFDHPKDVIPDERNVIAVHSSSQNNSVNSSARATPQRDCLDIHAEDDALRRTINQQLPEKTEKQEELEVEIDYVIESDQSDRRASKKKKKKDRSRESSRKKGKKDRRRSNSRDRRSRSRDHKKKSRRRSRSRDRRRSRSPKSRHDSGKQDRGFQSPPPLLAASAPMKINMDKLRDKSKKEKRRSKSPEKKRKEDAKKFSPKPRNADSQSSTTSNSKYKSIPKIDSKKEKKSKSEKQVEQKPPKVDIGLPEPSAIPQPTHVSVFAQYQIASELTSEMLDIAGISANSSQEGISRQSSDTPQVPISPVLPPAPADAIQPPLPPVNHHPHDQSLKTVYKNPDLYPEDEQAPSFEFSAPNYETSTDTIVKFNKESLENSKSIMKRQGLNRNQAWAGPTTNPFDKPGNTDYDQHDYRNNPFERKFNDGHDDRKPGRKYEEDNITGRFRADHTLSPKAMKLRELNKDYQSDSIEEIEKIDSLTENDNIILNQLQRSRYEENDTIEEIEKFDRNSSFSRTPSPEREEIQKKVKKEKKAKKNFTLLEQNSRNSEEDHSPKKKQKREKSFVKLDNVDMSDEDKENDLGKEITRKSKKNWITTDIFY